MMRRVVLLSLALLPLLATAQFNVDRLIMSGRSALYYEDYVLAIQHFNRAIDSKPYLYEPWFYRGVAKFYLDDFAGAERDCSEAISLNPYVTGIYELRGLCRIRLKKFESAISDYDRAAPHGTGHIKAGLNYAMSLYQIMDAHRNGFDENLYLDPATRTKIEETGGANVLLVKKDGTIVIPKSPSILPSITRRSLVTIAGDVLGMKVEEREVEFQEVRDGEFAECGLCGTAAVISPVGRIYDHGTYYDMPSGMEAMGPVTKKLYDTLTGIQMGTIEGPEGWVHVID